MRTMQKSLLRREGRDCEVDQAFDKDRGLYFLVRVSSKVYHPWRSAPWRNCRTSPSPIEPSTDCGRAHLGHLTPPRQAGRTAHDRKRGTSVRLL